MTDCVAGSSVVGTWVALAALVITLQRVLTRSTFSTATENVELTGWTEVAVFFAQRPDLAGPAGLAPIQAVRRTFKVGVALSAHHGIASLRACGAQIARGTHGDPKRTLGPAGEGVQAV